MQINRFYIIACIYIAISQVSLSQSLRLNEVQASNTIYLDENGDTPDWIELYNTTTNSINLEGWSLTDDLDKGEYWTFPKTSLMPNDYLAIWASGKNRRQSTIARSLVKETDEFRYIVPNQNTSELWRNINFNDDNWQMGNGGFGYGDGDDQTILTSGTRAVFIRKEFEVYDLDALTDLYLDIDFDDAFVAYLNGVEIARDNINGNVPNYLSFANTDKEANMYSGGEPDQFDLKEHISLLDEGKNILAIQVHNNSQSSSDMTLRPFLTAKYSNETEDGSEVDSLLDYGQSRFHTDFKISSESEIVYLLDNNGIVHDSLALQNLPADISFGHTTDGNLGYFITPTLEAINAIDYYEGALTNNIIFSNNGGQVDPLSLTITTSTPFTTIRYTTDATEPSATSAIYNSSIAIASTSTIRARLFRDGHIPSQTVSRNFIIGEDHLLPVVSLITDPINLFDEEEGIYSYGYNYTNQLPYFGANFWKDEEKPIHFSYYGMDNDLKINLNAGTKIFGGWSRAYDQRSFSIFARKKYGPSDIEYPLFDERSYQSYGAIILRNAGNDNGASNMRDIIIHELIKDLDLESQAYQSVATYINEEYWGLYHMREKVNEHFLANKYDLDPKSITLLEGHGLPIHGSDEDYLALLNLISNGDVSNPNIYETVEARIDIDNFIDYFATQIYIDNTDWPGNNIKFWKPENGKWRWILYDTDFALNRFQEFGHFHNTLAFALEPNGPDWPNPSWSTLLLRNLVRNTEFRIKLVNRFADFMNSRFKNENIINVLNEKVDELQPEMVRHFIRWNYDTGTWFQQINRIETFAEERPDQMKNHIRSRFALPAVHKITITNPEISKGWVDISTLTIKEASWTGDYFENNPFVVKAIAKPGYQFSHWSGSVNSSEESIVIDMKNNMTIIPNFEQTENTAPTVVVNEINYKSSDQHDAGDWIELHNPGKEQIEITDWIIKDENDNNSFTFENKIIEAEGYLILCRDQEKFNTLYPNISIAGEIDFGLSSDDQVRVYDNNDTLIDSVNFNSLTPWPYGANGNGYTLELINPSLDNNVAENYANINLNGSPGRKNIINTNNKNINDEIVAKVYPNPTKDRLTISFEITQSKFIDLIITDSKGSTIVNQKNIYVGKGNNQIAVDVHHLSPGIYQLQLKDNAGKKSTISWIKI